MDGDNMDKIKNYIVVLYGEEVLANKGVQQFVSELCDLSKDRVGILGDKDTLYIRKCFGITSNSNLNNEMRRDAIKTFDLVMSNILRVNSSGKISIFDIDSSNDNLKNISLGALEFSKSRIILPLSRAHIYTIEDLVQCSTLKLRDIFNGNKFFYDIVVSKIHDLGLRFSNELFLSEIRDIYNGTEFMKNNDIGLLDINIKIYRALSRKFSMDGIKDGCIKDLISYRSYDFANVRNLGEKGFCDLQTKMHKYGLYFVDEKELVVDEVKASRNELVRLLDMKDSLLRDKDSLLEMEKDLDRRINYLREQAGVSDGKGRIKKSTV